MYEGTEPPLLNSSPSATTPNVKDFVDGDNPTERGWNVLENSFKTKCLAPVVKALRESGNKPVLVKNFPELRHWHLGGFNGASAKNCLYFRMVLVHKDRTFEDNEIRLYPLAYLNPNLAGNMRCSDL